MAKNVTTSQNKNNDWKGQVMSGGVGEDFFMVGLGIIT
jgi:hypothetical protein